MPKVIEDLEFRLSNQRFCADPAFPCATSPYHPLEQRACAANPFPQCDLFSAVAVRHGLHELVPEEPLRQLAQIQLDRTAHQHCCAGCTSAGDPVFITGFPIRKQSSPA